MRILLTWIANSVAILLVAWLGGGVMVDSVRDGFLAGAVLTAINAIVRPLLIILTLPLTILTLGLFYFVITGICLRLAAKLVPGFAVRGWFMTIVASILIGLCSAVISRALRKASE
jgi:putative membrane protein